jgi:hypothetical protein
MSAFSGTRAIARGGGKHMLVCFAAGGLCGMGLSGSVVANPPLSAGKSLLSTIDSVRSASAAGSRYGARQESVPKLDLRPPMDPMRARAPDPFALTSHSAFDMDDSVARPGFGTREAHFPLMSQPETLLHRVHREGVPIVRLWNSHSALLSIGLNQKGKPGLWLIQKIR